MLQTHLLAFGITHLTDARYFAAWNADYLCFPIGADALSLDEFVAIREWVEGPTCVVEWRRSAGELLTGETVKAYRITHILLDDDAPTGDWAGTDVVTMRRIPVAGYQTTEDIAERMATTTGPVILDFTAGGIVYEDLAEGSPFSIGELQQILGDRPAYLHIDLEAEDAEAAAAVFHGLALRGSSEEKASRTLMIWTICWRLWRGEGVDRFSRFTTEGLPRVHGEITEGSKGQEWRYRWIYVGLTRSSRRSQSVIIRVGSAAI